jgi:NAD-dependent deacetylase
LVTQNVDSLHALAGSKTILELHGNIYRNKCVDCAELHETVGEIDPENIPVCRKCGGKIRPDVVWFGEMLDPDIINTAINCSEKADVFFSVGTSALVYPAASLPVIAGNKGAVVVEINVEPTPLTNLADFHFLGKSGELLPQLVTELRTKKGLVLLIEK